MCDDKVFLCVFKGEIDAHEDSFRATDEAGQALLSTGHYASEEVKEKVGLLTASKLYFLSLCDIIFTRVLPCVVLMFLTVCCL